MAARSTWLALAEQTLQLSTFFGSWSAMADWNYSKWMQMFMSSRWPTEIGEGCSSVDVEMISAFRCQQESSWYLKVREHDSFWCFKVWISKSEYRAAVLQVISCLNLSVLQLFWRLWESCCSSVPWSSLSGERSAGLVKMWLSEKMFETFIIMQHDNNKALIYFLSVGFAQEARSNPEER